MLRTSLLHCLTPLAITVLSALPAWSAQDGQLDPSFNPMDDGTFGDGPNYTVDHILVQPDGKSLIVGQFSEFSGVPRPALARLQTDGSLDTSFDPGSVFPGSILALALQPDGKVLLAGGFTVFDGVPTRAVVRLEPNGDVDPSFTSGLGAINAVTAIALQPDGKILVAGRLDVAGTPSYTVRRMLPDGAVDSTFNAGVSADAYPHGLALQPDGKILVCGGFFSIGGIARNRVARLEADGSVDASFHPGTGPDNIAFDVLLQPDGRVLISGYFTAVGGVARQYVSRLTSNGALDPSFDPGSGANSWVRTMALQSDGKVLLGGQFSAVGGQAALGVARLNTDGSVDPTFDSGNAASGTVWAVAQQSDGKVLIGGEFTSVAGLNQRRLARLTASGSHDGAYNGGSGADDVVQTIALRPDGGALVGGQFTRFNGTNFSRIVGLDRDGEVDPSFDPGAGVDFIAYAIAYQTDGKALIAGGIWNYDGAPARSIVRVNPDGSRDPSFDAGTGSYPSAPFAVVVQPDGRILVGGSFFSFNGQDRGSIVRLLSDGSVDPTFTTPGGGTNGVSAISLLPNGKILIAGGFTSYGTTPRNRIARLNADGSLDMSFNSTVTWNHAADSSINAMIVQPNGKILIGGAFTSYDGVARGRIARLNANGTLDASFAAGVGVTSNLTLWPYITTLALQPDGKVLLGGVFTHVDGVARKNLARLDANGALDASFAVGQGANGAVQELALDPHGRVWVGGEFTALHDAPRSRLARLFAYDVPAVSYCTAGTSSNGCTPSLIASGSASVAAASGFTLSVSGLEGQRQGLFFYGVSGHRATPWGQGSTSFACVANPVQRMDVSNSGGSNGQCDGALNIDWRAWIAARPTALGQPLFVGQLVHAQAWYRDPPAPRGTNLSNAAEFLVRP